MNRKNFLLITLVALAGGSIPPFAKVALRDFGPFTLAFLRFLGASIVMYAFLPKEDRSMQKLLRLKWVALVGALNPIFVFLALQHLPANVTSLFYALIPGLGVWYLWTVHHVKESAGQLMGFMLGLAGVAIISTQTVSKHTDNNPWLGIVFISIAVLSFFVYGILSKEYQRRHRISGVSLAFYFAVVTTLVSLPLAVYETFSHPWMEHLQAAPVISMLYLGLIGTGVQYLLYQKSLSLMEPAHANIFVYLQSVLGVILAALFVGESITLPLLLGGLIVLLGSRLALAKPRPTPTPAEP